MQQHYGRRAEQIDSEEIWDLEANCIALALNNITMTIGPEKIVLGGGLVQHDRLIEKVRSKLGSAINGYLQIPNLNEYIVKSSGDTNGVLGAIKLITLS
jgi:fructokinase